MEENIKQANSFEAQIDNFLSEFMNSMYKGHDHIIARKYFRDLFNELIPKYFCVIEEEKSKIESGVK